MTWVNLPIETDEGPLSREQRAVMAMTDGDTCRVRLADGEELEATLRVDRGSWWVDDDGEQLDVVAVFVRTPSGPSGKTTLDRRLLSQTSEEFAEQDARAKAEGVSWSTWARRRLSAK